MHEPLRLISDAFDARAARYDESAMHRSVAAATAEFLDLSGADVVLDVASGTGLVLREIASRATDAHLIGVDISAGMLDVARSHLPQARWIEAEASAIPLPSGSVDLITCVTALHIIPEVAGAAAEWQPASAARRASRHRDLPQDRHVRTRRSRGLHGRQAL